jgi:hypothetical protein
MSIAIASPYYVCLTGSTFLAQTATLAEMKKILAETFSPNEREDVAVWEIAADGRARVALVLTADGRTLELDGPSICWQWPTRRDAAG